jgi:hypothetical protein
VSSGAAHASYLASNGGAWSADGRTLPAVLDLEAGCHGLSQAAMRTWIADFEHLPGLHRALRGDL